MVVTIRMLAAVLFGTFLMQPAHATEHVLDLETAKDHTRPLLIFAPALHDPQWKRQCAALSNEALITRDVVVALVVQDSSYAHCGHLNSTAQAHIAHASAVRQRFLPDSRAFTVILVGKDGEEKLRSSKPISLQLLIDTIDAMPLRQSEMNAKRSH